MPYSHANRIVARIFVDFVNALTSCAHCGAQPVEWHNPDHVEKNRRHFRIKSMAAAGFPINRIILEMGDCTPLCRRCHMIEDGRMERFKTAGQEAVQRLVKDPAPCIRCQKPSKPMRRGMCRRCYDGLRYVPDPVRPSAASDGTCRRGHPKIEENAYYAPKTGKRDCKPCRAGHFQQIA